LARARKQRFAIAFAGESLMRSPTAVCSALVLAWLGSVGVARTETAVAENAAKDAPTPADNPAIAPPAPGAPPQKVEDAKKTAKVAALTPILPSPKNPLRPAFQLYAEIDLPILGIGLVFEGARLVRTQPAFCAPLCDRGSLNALDRTTAGYWSPGWQTASDYALYAIGVGAVTLLFVDEGFLPGLNDAVVVAESALAATAVASAMTLSAGRPRPFLYGEKAPLSARNSASGGLSYLSSHAAISFAIATSTLVTMRRLHPHSKATWIVMGVGGAIATFVAAARVLGGMHFITDVAGGAIVGVSMGLLVPSLHASPVTIVPVAGDGQRGIAVSARF
jgi:membrane-associated phospholipid phosphatase